MIKEFIVYRDTITEALDHLDDFKTKMDSFVEKNPHYTYEESVELINDSWEVKINVIKNEQLNIETT